MRALLKSARFRANPAYRAVARNRLSEAEALALASEPAEPGVFGILRPAAGSELPTLIADRETALLFLSMAEPGPLPDYVEAVFGAAGERGLERLLLDRILEVEGPNGFVGGPAACELLGLETPLGRGQLARLSQAALRYGEALELDDAWALSARLYRFNQHPASPRWRRRVPDPEAAARFLGLGPGGSLERTLRRAWRPVDSPDGWLLFTACAPKAAAGGSPCKLYVSPAPQALPETLAIAAETLAASPAREFKVGGDLYGLLRPDKLVAYFANRQALLEAADSLRPRLEGLPFQGVPFTAEAGGAMLSWGADPMVASNAEGHSWRHWITNRLAVSLIAGRTAAGSSVAPWRFALERLKLDGVDPETFRPTAGWAGRQSP